MSCGLCRQPPGLELSQARRVFIFVVGVLETVFFSGVVFGWPLLVHVLKVEGLYADLCDGPSPRPSPVSAAASSVNTTTALHSPRDPPLQIFNNTRCFALNNTFEVSTGQSVGVEQCGPQDERFALIYTVLVACYALPGVFVGYLLHHAGLRASRITAGTMMGMSFLFLGISTKESPDWLFPSMVLMALGGNQLRMAVFQFADLFPLHRATALTFLSGLYASSAAFFIVFQYAALLGITRAHLCWLMAGGSVVTILSTFFMPAHHIPAPGTYGEDEARPQESSTPLKRSLFSASSFLTLYWFFVSLLVVNTYQQGYNLWINLSSCSVEEAGLYSMLYSYSNLFTVFIGPIGGAFTDFLVRRASKASSDLTRRVKEVQASFWPLMVTSVASVLLVVCKFFLHPAAVYLSLVFMIVCRPCVIAFSNSFIRIRFPADHFNRLIGVYGTLSSILLTVQYPYFVWSQHNYYAALGVLGTLAAVGLMYPVHLLFTPLIQRAVLRRDQTKQNQLLAVDASAMGDKEMQNGV